MTPIFVDSQKPSARWVKTFGIGSWVLAALCAWFIMNSYPMMYPGYDVWWHLGVMQTGAAYDPSMVEYARWHRLWDRLFVLLEIRDIFVRALIIHRVQFFLTVLAIGAASYLSLLAVFRRRGYTSVYLFAALLSVGIWLSMHGTHSSAHFGGEESAATQSWIMWYSVNYQIALPFYFLATAGTLSMVSGGLHPRELWIVGVVTFVALGALAYCHLAEFPYYLFALVLFVVIFGGGVQKIVFLFVFLVGVSLLLLALPHISHRLPELPRLLISGSYSEILRLIEERGHWIANEGGNRGETSWNSLYTVSLMAFFVVMLFCWCASVRRLLRFRSLVFLVGTSLLPIALFNQFSAGVLSVVTNQDLAWRFSFSSFLYLGLPILLVLVLAQFLDAMMRSLGLFLATVLIVLAVMPFSSSVVQSNVESIERSLFPDLVHYGLSKENRATLMAISSEMDSDQTSHAVCLDVFSTYYLFYVLGQKNICLPSAISSLPGAADPSFSPENCPCSFDRQFVDFLSRGLTPPVWNFRFK